MLMEPGTREIAKQELLRLLDVILALGLSDVDPALAHQEFVDPAIVQGEDATLGPAHNVKLPNGISNRSIDKYLKWFQNFKSCRPGIILHLI